MANLNTSNVNVGTAPNTNTGDTIRDAFVKVNENFYSLYRNGQFLANTKSTASIPAYSFETDKDTGFYNSSPGIVGLALNGQEYLLAKVTGEITWKGEELSTKNYVTNAISSIGAAGGLLGIPIVSALPSAGLFEGRLVHYNLDNETYIYLDNNWIKYKENIMPNGPTGIEIVNTFPTNNLWEGRTVNYTPDNSLYIYADSAWVKILKFYTNMANGFTSVDVVTSLPSANLFDGRQVMYNDIVYIYKNSSTSWEVLSGNVGGGGLEIVANVPTTGNFEGRLIIQGNIFALANTLVYTSDGYKPLGNYITSNVQIGANSIYTAALQDYSVTTVKLANATVTELKMTDNSVNTNAIVNLSITSNKLQSNAVTSAKIANGAVVTENLANDAVTIAKIAAGAVTTAKIADSNVTTSKLVDYSVTELKLANNSVVSDRLSANAVTTQKISDGNVTYSKLASDVVTQLASSVSNAVSSPKFAYAVGVGRVAIPKIHRFISSVQAGYSWPLPNHPTDLANYNLLTDNYSPIGGGFGAVASWNTIMTMALDLGTVVNNYPIEIYFRNKLSQNTFATSANEGYVLLYRVVYNPVNTVSYGYTSYVRPPSNNGHYGQLNISSSILVPNLGDERTGHISTFINSSGTYNFALQATSVRVIVNNISYDNDTGIPGNFAVFTSEMTEMKIRRY